jgi:flagellin-like protein
LIAGVIVQSGRTLCKASQLPKSAVSGVLVVLLLVAMTFSVSHSLHRILHDDGARSDHFCLACSLAKGQVGALGVASISAVLVLCCFWVDGRDHTTPSCGFDYRLSPSRAPPLT